MEFTRNVNGPIVHETVENFINRKRMNLSFPSSFPDFSCGGDAAIIFLLLILFLLVAIVVMLVHSHMTSARFFVDARGIGLPSKPASHAFRDGNVLVWFQEIDRIETTLDQKHGPEFRIWYGRSASMIISSVILPSKDRDALLKFFISRKDLRARMTSVQKRTMTGSWFKREHLTPMTLSELEHHVWMSAPSRTRISWNKDDRIFLFDC